MIGGTSRVYAILGNPVGHSLSPAMHNAAFQALGIDAVYVAIPAAADEVGPLMRALVRARGGGNLTVPHKRLGARFVRSADGTPLESCNTFWGEGTEVVGAETDSVGIGMAWEEMGSPRGDWLIVGTGGSALAAARAAARSGAKVAIRSRAPERQAEFESGLEGQGVELSQGRAIGFVINCTPLGLGANDPVPIKVDDVPRDAGALDLVYRREMTPWVRALRKRGVLAHDGRDVLVSQGAAAFERWFPGVRAPVEVMRAAVRRALG